MKTKWKFPIDYKVFSGIPIGNHPGAFGVKRKYDKHCGIDLYCPVETKVFAVEKGVIVSIEAFTGKEANCHWWLDTWAVKINGETGIICYGEICPNYNLKKGQQIKKGDLIGYVIPVLRPEKLRKDIPGHSCSMLHLQIYKKDVIYKNEINEDPEKMIDPTPFLLDSLKNKNIAIKTLKINP